MTEGRWKISFETFEHVLATTGKITVTDELEIIWKGAVRG
jgi:uncharacterized cupin superfamily protein